MMRVFCFQHLQSAFTLCLLSLTFGQATLATAQEAAPAQVATSTAPREVQVEVTVAAAAENTVAAATDPKIEVQATTNPKPAETDQPASEAKPDVKKHPVKAEAFQIAFELEGVVDSPAYQVVNLRTKALKELKLQGNAVHGQRVTRGQPILQLDAEVWERAKRSAEQAVTSAKLELDQAKKQASTAEEATRLELEAAELSERSTHEDLEYFLRQGKAQQAEALKESLKNSEQNVEYTREEFEQLKKMYEADEITEETEEIVLKRAKNDLERSEYFLKNTRIRVDRSLNIDLERQEVQIKNAAARAKLDLELARLNRSQKLESVQLQLARAEAALESAKRELAMLDEDRQFLSQFSQLQGVLFFGVAERGQWKGSGNLEELFVPGGMLPAGRTLMTIVGTERLFVQAKLAEKWLRTIKPGMKAYLVLTSNRGSRIPLEVEEVSLVPLEPGQYRASFRFSRPADAADLLPLLSGKIHGIAYEKANALLIPIEAVQYDHATAFVQVVDEKTGEQRRQDVSIGEQDDKRVEIVQGLREGEHVVLP